MPIATFTLRTDIHETVLDFRLGAGQLDHTNKKIGHNAGLA